MGPFRHATGNSLVEYAIPLGIFMTVGVAALILTDVPERLADFFADTVHGDVAGGTIAVKEFGELPAGTSLPPGLQSGSTVTFNTGSGLTVTLPSVPSVTDSVETAGANGTTDQLLAALTTLVDQLENAGELDETQANLLQELADAGYRMAEVERLIEEAAAACGSDHACFMSSRVDWEGENVPVPSLIGELGTGYNFSQLAGGNPLSTTWPTKPGVEDDHMHQLHRDFVEAYADAASNGAMDDPVVQEVVESMATQISLLSEMTKILGEDVIQGRPPETLNDPNASYITTIDSEGICTAGGGGGVPGASCS